MAQTPEEKKAYRKRWKEANREHVKRVQQEYEARPEIKAHIRAYRATPEFRARNKIHQSNYRERNHEQILAYCREYNSRSEVQERARAWRKSKEGPVRRRQRSNEERRRRSKKLGCSEGRCVYCGRHCSLFIDRGQPGHGQVDHIIPVSKGGSDERENLQLTCQDCNRAKNTMNHEEFVAYLKEICDHLFGKKD